jgi:hypothetical protein
MNLSDIRFPRQLEADETAETIRKALMARTVKLWPGGTLDVARITMDDPLKKVLRTARLKGQIRYGFEAIFDMEIGFQGCFYFPTTAPSVFTGISNPCCRRTRRDCSVVFSISTAAPWGICSPAKTGGSSSSWQNTRMSFPRHCVRWLPISL